MRCASCGAEISAASRVCPDCGALRAGEQDPTVVAPAAGFRSPPRPSPPAATPSSASGARFAAGAVLLDRYRIVSLLGRGGMGEVYRADDLKLDTPVALKFLPEAAAASGGLLDRLLAEVRLARQISHPNVCRVYDVAEWGATHFLSMEYIDGEDLATLLRRIGRLPRDKAAQIARQLCAGLAAAHARGVLHRDLKPSNVMIDGDGNARITDFGLAALAEGVGAEEAGLGTPGYMAPEQLSGREVSARSDLYALGLVLYELFTGRKAYPAESAAELARLRESGPPTPSSVVAGFDPGIERVVMRCLERDPAARPISALAVAAALPGGDPLAAALEAGETPSPELVARARVEGGLAPRVAWSGAALALAGLGLVVALSARSQISRLVPLPRSAEVLADRAADIIRSAGYTETPRDTLSGFAYDADYFEASGTHARGWQAMATDRPSPLYFWHRQGPRHLVPYDRIWPPDYDDPPLNLPGMVSVQLDPAGRLLRFEAVPPDFDPPGGASPDPDWDALLARAEIDPERLRPAEPAWTPPVWADRRAAWEGELPGGPAAPVRVEAAAYRGRPVWFRVVPSWLTPFEPAPAPNLGRSIAQILFVSWSILALAGAVLVARRNLRLDRSDRLGAFRLAAYLLSVRLLIWVFGAHHVAAFGELQVFFVNLASALWRFGLVWLFYTAMEPYLRKIWPRMLVSWVRVLQGRFADPLVGRDVFVGCLFGLVALLIFKLQAFLPGWLGYPPPRADRILPLWLEVDTLAGPRHALGALLLAHDNQVISLLFAVTGLLLLRLLLRRTGPAVAVWVAVAVFMFNPNAGTPWLDLAFTLSLMLLAAVVLFRFGLLTLLAGWTVDSVLQSLPLTFDLTAWYAYASVLALATVLGLLAWGFWASLAGRPLFADELADG